MERISELTYQILAYSELTEVNSNEAIDWASEMISLGYESPHLFMLASFTKPTNYFEVIDYVKKSVAELGFEMKEGRAALMSYATYYVIQISKETIIRSNLDILYRLYQQTDEEHSLHVFYLLSWAWDDLDYDPNYTHYWEGATRYNIAATVIKEAKKWLQGNKPVIAQRYQGK